MADIASLAGKVAATVTTQVAVKKAHEEAAKNPVAKTEKVHDMGGNLFVLGSCVEMSGSYSGGCGINMSKWVCECRGNAQINKTVVNKM